MKKEDICLYFSPATDTTGRKLVESLGIIGVDSGKKGQTSPPKKAKMIIGWGPKTTEDVTFPKNTVVLNHPNSVRGNRNKLQALESMKNAGVNVAAFQAVDIKCALTLPVIGRTKYHQGGKGFWDCPTNTHVNNAIKAGADYLQELIEIKDEFRLHVFGEEVLYGVKKVKRTDAEFEKAFIEDEFTRQKKLWEKNNEGAFNEEQALEILRRQAKNAVAGGPNMMIRSNKLGWKFSRITKYDENLVKEAVNALKALKLDFGAVDCCTDASGKAFIIEVNTGPGLEGTPFEKYVETFTKIIDAGKSTGTKKKVGGKPVPKVGAVGTGKSQIEAQVLSGQVERLKEKLDTCENPEQLSALRALGSVIFGGQ